MDSVIRGLADFLWDNLGILGGMIMLGIAMFWWVIAIFVLIGLLYVGFAAWSAIMFMRHPIANFRKLRECRRLAKEEEARSRAYVPRYDYSPPSDDNSSSGSGGDSGGEPSNGGGPDEYGPSPGYGGMGGP